MRCALWLGLSAGLLGCGSSGGGGGGGGGVGGGGTEPVLALAARKTEAEFCDYYATRYPTSSAPASVGSDLACVPGEITPDGIQQHRDRLDFYREWLGLSKTKDPDPAITTRAQECAMMMGTAQDLSHEPGTDWSCYTPAGAEGASQSNIAIGIDTAAEAIDLYIFDHGNEDNPGHRRWLFFPTYEGPGYGWFDAGPGGPFGRLSGSCVVAFEGYPDHENAKTAEPIAYPPAGAFPAALTYASGFYLSWTLSWEDASFANATLTLKNSLTQAEIPLRQPFMAIQKSSGSEAASWIPEPTPMVGERWTVRLDGVALDGVPQLPIVYEVEFVDCGVIPLF